MNGDQELWMPISDMDAVGRCATASIFSGAVGRSAARPSYYFVDSVKTMLDYVRYLP